MKDKEQRRSESPVSDARAERGITISNFLGACALALMSWIGINIDYIKNTMAIFQTEIAVNKTSIEHNKEIITNHLNGHNE